MRYLACVMLAAFAVGRGGSGVDSGGGPIRVLLVTGVDHPAHDWKARSSAIRSVLESGKRFEVRVVEDPEVLATDLLDDYAVVFLNFKNFKPLVRETQIRGKLVNYVRSGHGLVLMHFACGAFEEWKEFDDLAGRVWDRKTSHDPRGPFLVKITDAAHPITRSMRDFETDDELYICLVGQRPVNVLATARSKITGKDHPMAFAFQYERGRVFHTPLGHDARAIEIPGAAELLRRGCAWAAGREP